MKIDINGMLVDLQEGDRVISSWVATSKELHIQIWRESTTHTGVWDNMVYEHSEKL